MVKISLVCYTHFFNSGRQDINTYVRLLFRLSECFLALCLLSVIDSYISITHKRDNLLLLLKNHLGAMDISQGLVCKYQGSVPTIVPKEQKVTQAQSIANRHNC